MKSKTKAIGAAIVVLLLLAPLANAATTTVSATVSSLVQISVTPSSASFGSISPGTSNDTTDGSPGNFTIENTGNVDVNVTISATAIWSGESKAASDYQFKSSNKETGSATTVVSSFTDLTTSAQDVAKVLKFGASTDTAYVDVKITVPADEPTGSKSSTITFTASQA